MLEARAQMNGFARAKGVAFPEEREEFAFSNAQHDQRFRSGRFHDRYAGRNAAIALPKAVQCIGAVTPIRDTISPTACCVESFSR